MLQSQPITTEYTISFSVKIYKAYVYTCTVVVVYRHYQLNESKTVFYYCIHVSVIHSCE